MIEVSKLADGTLDEKLNRALKQAVENIVDPNTDYKKERKVTIEICIKPTSERRDFLQTTIKTKVSLAPEKGEDTELIVGKDVDGKIHINERRQVKMNEFIKQRKENNKVVKL